MNSFTHSSQATFARKKTIKVDPSPDFFVNPALAQSAQIKLVKMIKEAATRLNVLSDVSDSTDFTGLKQDGQRVDIVKVQAKIAQLTKLKHDKANDAVLEFINTGKQINSNF